MEIFNGNFWSPLAPLLGEIEICVHLVFCGKFNYEQLLFEAFFNIICIVCRVKLFLQYSTFDLFTFGFLSVLVVHGYMVKGLDYLSDCLNFCWGFRMVHLQWFRTSILLPNTLLGCQNYLIEVTVGLIVQILHPTILAAGLTVQVTYVEFWANRMVFQSIQLPRPSLDY